MTVHPALDSAFAALDRHGVQWCLLRGWSDLAHPTGDVDLLIERGGQRQLRRALADTDLVHLRTWTGGSQSFFRAAAHDGWTAALHVVDRLSFGPFGSLATSTGEQILARRRREAGLPVLSEADEFWVTLLHCLLDKRTIAPKHRLRLQELTSREVIDSPLATAVGQLDPVGFAATRFLEPVAAACWEEVEARAEPLARAWRRAQRFSAPLRYLASRVALNAHKVIEAITRPGLVVAVLAPDGAGKSTLVTTLASSLPVSSRSYYLGSYGETLTSQIGDVPGLRFLERAARLAGRGLRARWDRRRRRVALLDRHPMEALGQPPNRPSDRIRRRALAWLVPRPDVTIVLDAPGDVLHARSGEHDAASLETRRQRYRDLAGTVRGAVVVDATLSPEEVAGRARAAIWDAMRSRWPR